MKKVNEHGQVVDLAPEDVVDYFGVEDDSEKFEPELETKENAEPKADEVTVEDEDNKAVTDGENEGLANNDDEDDAA